MGAVGLLKGLPDRGSDNRVMAEREMRQRIAHPVNAAPLPCGLEHTCNGSLQAGMGVTNDQPDLVLPPFQRTLRRSRFDLR